MLQRTLRDGKELLRYPLWLFRGKPAPDNHVYKVSRIIRLARQFGCSTLIETGTYYGQTTAAAVRHFQKVLSVELFEPLYRFNLKQFADWPNVHIFYGSSEDNLAAMIAEAEGRILFWLDGHFSGNGTAKSTKVSPLTDELAIIRHSGRKEDVILIDDVRCFDGVDYPTWQETAAALHQINPHYEIQRDGDCLVATI